MAVTIMGVTLCTPLVIYVILSMMTVISALFTSQELKRRLLNTTMTVLWSMLWGYIMYELCASGHTGVAWAMLLFPLVALVLVASLIVLVYDS